MVKLLEAIGNILTLSASDRAALITSINEYVEPTDGSGPLSAVREALFERFTALRSAVTSDADVDTLAELSAAITSLDARMDEALAAEKRRAEVLAVANEIGARSTEQAETLAGTDGASDASTGTPETPPATPQSQLRADQLAGQSAEPAGSADAGATEQDNQAVGQLGAGVVAASGVGSTPGEPMSRAELERAVPRFARTIRTRGVTDGFGARKTIGYINANARPGLTADLDMPLAALIAEHNAARRESARVVASGGICAPPKPDYSMGVIGGNTGCYTNSLPTFVSDKQLAYFNDLLFDIAQIGAAPGIGHVTLAQDTVGYGNPVPPGGAPFKTDACATASCEKIDTCEAEATYKCTTIGNFMQLLAAEQVAAFETLTMAYFNAARDMRFVQKLLDSVEAHNGFYTYAPAGLGAARNLADVIKRVVAAKRWQRADKTLEFDVYVDGFVGSLVSADLMKAMGTSGSSYFFDGADASADAGFAKLASENGIYITPGCVPLGTSTSPDPSGAAGFTLPGGGPNSSAAVALPDWPSTVRMAIVPTGSVFNVNHGMVEFGMHEAGAKSNDASTFMEVIEAFCVRNISDAVVVDVNVCVNGVSGGTQVVECK